MLEVVACFLSALLLHQNGNGASLNGNGARLVWGKKVCISFLLERYECHILSIKVNMNRHPGHGLGANKTK